MTSIDWIVVVAWVVGTSAFGFSFRRQVKSTRDFLLAGRRLRWWQIAIAQSADAVDATDFVATTGHGFRTGMSQVGFAWWGMGLGSLLLSRYITPLLYRTGVYTNAEYLALRYTPSLRIASAILQVLYRFVAMALVVYAMATMFNVIVGIDLWLGVWGAMILTLIYVFASGQLGVVMAAIPQVVLMMVTSVLVFIGATMEFGGLDGFREHAPALGDLVHLAGHEEPGVSGGVYLWGLILTLLTYPIVNQTVAQRIVGARSEMDARKGTVASLLPWCLITGVSTAVGIMGVVLMPELRAEKADHLFPRYMELYLGSLGPGVLGLGVAALVVASISTGAGIGTAISGLVTRDVLGYSTGKESEDRRFLWLTRVFACLSIICGTMFAMLIPHFKGMIPFYVAFTGTFFLPLTVPYIGGALYRRASRGSGMASLAAGVGVGSILFLGDHFKFLPTEVAHPQCRPFLVLEASFLVFFGWSMVENWIKGPPSQTDVAGMLNSFDLGKPATPEEVKAMIQSRPFAPWPGKDELDYEKLGISKKVAWYAHPSTFELIAVVLLIVLMIWWW
jgi:SSS family solute:Na+ symporter